jgi:hypothetical protein
MVIYRLPGTKELLIHSAVCVDESTLKVMETLGKIKYLIVPNGLHRLDAAAYVKRFPDIRVLAPSFAREAVERGFMWTEDLGGKVVVVEDCEEVMMMGVETMPFKSSGNDGMESYDAGKNDKLIPGIRYMVPYADAFELIYILDLEDDDTPLSKTFDSDQVSAKPLREATHSRETVLVCTDLFFNIPPEKADPITKWIGSAHGFGITFMGSCVIPDLKGLKTWIKKELLERLEELGISAILVGHGDEVLGVESTKRALQEALRKL